MMSKTGQAVKKSILLNKCLLCDRHITFWVYSQVQGKASYQRAYILGEKEKQLSKCFQIIDRRYINDKTRIMWNIIFLKIMK